MIIIIIKKNKKYIDDSDGDLISSYRNDFVIEIKFNKILMYGIVMGFC